MSTRGFVGFAVNGTEKISYNHCDSYPSGLGSDVLTFLRKEHAGYIHRKAEELRVVDHDSVPTAEDIERLGGYANTNVSTQRTDDWYVLLRETQGDLAATLNAGVMVDGSDFPRDSLYAEFGYIVNLDDGTFEAYRGFQHAQHDKGRFADREPMAHSVGVYYPCALVASWPLTALPTDEELAAAFESESEEMGT